MAHAVYEVRIFSVLENRVNRLGDEGAMGAIQNFWARTATAKRPRRLGGEKRKKIETTAVNHNGRRPAVAELASWKWP